MLAHPPYHQQPPPQQPQQQQPPSQPSSSATTVAPANTVSSAEASQQQPQDQPQPAGTFQTLRLHDESQPITQPAPRTSRKRKSPASSTAEQPQVAPPPPGMIPAGPPQVMPGHPLPPPHNMVPPPHMGGPPLPHGYQYVPNDYSTGGMPPQPPPPPPPGQQPSPTDQQQQAQAAAAAANAAGRTLSQSKRAEQNRKAQRAFRERRDQHVKALESRSQLLDAALASADEANRRWEECRALVDQLRIENAALRAALSQAQSQMLNGSNGNNQTEASASGMGDKPPSSAPADGQGGADGANQEGATEGAN
ncbi:hypothetical protein C8Q75DRAFT_808230 [Abortiporus biennis]|nr:hypothetical protein C8Q75DRAFT_808230 [Abortiporus biennis]